MGIRYIHPWLAILAIMILSSTVISCDRHTAPTDNNTVLPTSGLHRAAALGDRDQVARWINNGTSVDVKDNHDWTPLHWAAVGNHVETAGLLLDHGADPNARGQFDMTPLHWAAIKARAEMVKLLATRGARLDARNLYGRTPLHEAADPPVARALLAAGATLEARDDRGMTPLHTAREGLIAKALTQAGADPRVQTHDGHSALQLAVAENLDAQGLSVQMSARPLRLRGGQARGSFSLRSVTERPFEDLVITAKSPGCDVTVSPSPIARFDPGQMTQVEATLTRRPGVADGVYFVYFTAIAKGRELGIFDLKVDTTSTVTPEDAGMIRVLQTNVKPPPARISYIVYAIVPVLLVIGWMALRWRMQRANTKDSLSTSQNAQTAIPPTPPAKTTPKSSLMADESPPSDPNVTRGGDAHRDMPS